MVPLPQGIHGFSFVLVVGVMVGTYSSIYIARPVLMWLARRHADSGNKPAAVAAALTNSDPRSHPQERDHSISP